MKKLSKNEMKGIKGGVALPTCSCNNETGTWVYLSQPTLKEIQDDTLNYCHYGSTCSSLP